MGIALWYLAGVKRSKTVAVTREAEDFAGCTRQTFAKGLDALETVGLISVKRHAGRRPVVTVLAKKPDTTN